MSESKLFLIDANALCYRAFFAIKDLITSYGQATNAVYGFINTLRKILRDYNPQYMAICFDVGKKTRRQEKFSQYKIHRPPMPDDLVSQIPLIKKIVLAFNLPIFEMEGFEADDVIATIVKKTQAKNLEVVIVSGDKDMLQLVNSSVKVFNTKTGTIVGKKEAEKIFGIDPEKITDYIGLAGDQTDNIPGVMGIGGVTARELINQFGALENIIKNVDKIKSSKLQEKLSNQKEIAIFSKELATLDYEVPIEFNLNSIKVGEPDGDYLFELFKELEFRKLAEEFSPVKPKETKLEVKEINTEDKINDLCEEILKNGGFAFSLNDLDATENTLFYSLVVSTGRNYVYNIAKDKIRYLKKVFEETKVVKICWNVKELIKILNDKDVLLKGKVFDIMLAGYLLAPSKGPFDVASLAWNYLKVSLSSEDNLMQKTHLIFKLYSVLLKELEVRSLLKLFDEIEMPLARVLSDMESEGVKIDEHLLKKLSDECQKKIETLIKKLYKLAGMEFNLNSPKQLSHVLFEKLKLPVAKKTKTGFSTDESVLTKLALKHELPALILEYRQLTKLKSTYIDALPKLINRSTNRIHASFNQTGTETGRLSSSNPNLQNIPIRTELGRQIRKAFIPSKGGSVIISADYSQIELRILSHLSQDKNLIKAFKSDQDVHSFTASLIFDVKEDKVTYDMRNTAKRVNFGIMYGISSFGLAKDLRISQVNAQEFIDKYFLRYPSVQQFMENEIKKAEENGFVLTLLNRRRYLPEIKSDNMAIRQYANRQAINTPVQGSAADLIKLAMINIQEELKSKNFKSKMIITVHDELVFDVPKEEQDNMIELIRDRMENPISLSVPIKVSIKIGKNWLDLKEV